MPLAQSPPLSPSFFPSWASSWLSASALASSNALLCSPSFLPCSAMQPILYRNNLLSRFCCIALSLVLSFSFLFFSLAYPKRAHAIWPIAIAGGALAGVEFAEVSAAVGALVAAGAGIAIGAGAVQEYGDEWFAWYGKDSTAEDWTAQDWQNLNTAHLCEVIGIAVTNSNGQRPPDPDFEPNEDYQKLARVLTGFLSAGVANAGNMAEAAPGIIDWLRPGDNSAITGLLYPSQVTSSDGAVFLVDSSLTPLNYGFTRALDNSSYSYDVVRVRGDGGSSSLCKAYPVDAVCTSFQHTNWGYRAYFDTYDHYACFYPNDWRHYNDCNYVNVMPSGDSYGTETASYISPRIAQAIDSSFAPEQTINDSLPLLSDPESVTGYIGDAMSDIVGAVQTAQQYWQNLHNNAGLVPEGATEPAPYKIIEPLQVPITNDIPYTDIVRDIDHDPNPDPYPDPNPDPNPNPNPDPVVIDPDSMQGATDSLLSLFPFCLPHDLHYITSRLVAAQVAPSFVWVFDFSAFGIGRHELAVDLNDYADIARLIRFMLLVSFMVGWLLFLIKTKPWDIGT